MSREGTTEAAPPASDDKPASRDVVDPLIRAHIYSLCTALGGPSVEDPTTYTLGDDALACLKDLRRWLKFYDEKTNRYDVARCLSEMNLVAGDLLEILSQWKDAETGNKPRHRIALACVELLTPLTWPFEKMNDQMTVNHHRHLPVLQHAQMVYKKAILRHKSGKMLKTVVRTCLPAMAMPSTERSDREEGIIKLVLYVLRNIAIIEHPSPSEFDTGEEINRSATINAFADQNVFDLLLTIASGIEEDFRVQDGVLMEVLYHLVKGIDVESVFQSDREEAEQRGKNLTQLLKMEDDMKRVRASAAPTRHNRFGTTIWMERDDGTRSFVSGQDALLGKATGLEKIDQSKKWKKPKGGDMKGVSTKTEFDMKVPLEATARKHLEKFVEDFIDSGFNPLFMSIRKALDRDVDRLLNSHAKQYFYLVAWFLSAERIRRRNAAKARKKHKESATEEDSFSIVAAVLNQEFLITLNRKMTEWFDMKLWKELQAGMRCFTQMLYTVQDMAVSPIEDDQEIAENIQNRLFYEETTMNLSYDICRSYTKQPFKWLDDCTEMVHVHLKLLEKYSQQHEHMFVRSRRRQNKKKKDVVQAAGEADNIGEENDEEMAAARRRAIAERAFDFRKFENKYLNPHCVNTFVAYLSYFKELDANQIMRAIKYFHRIFEKMKMEVSLYRLDLVDLFHRIMQGPDALPRSHAAYKDTDQFARHYLRKLFKKLESEPSLYVELLFTKINHDLHFLQHGYDKEIHVSKPRAAADLRIKSGVEMNHGEQVGVGVGALLDENKSHHVEWLKDVLTKAVRERKLWEDEIEARRALEAEGRDPDSIEPEAPAEAPKPPDIFINPDGDERKTAMFKDGVLRFLLKLVGCEKVDVNETPDTKWIIPSTIPLQVLAENLNLLQKYANDPPNFENDQTAAELLRRDLPRRNPERRVGLSSDESAGEDEEMLFEPGGPTAVKSLHEKKKKGERRKRQTAEPDDEVSEERRRKRLERELQKRNQIKSDKYVHSSDDEDDAEKDRAFFEREREIRAQGPRAIYEPPDLMQKVPVRPELLTDEDEDSEYSTAPVGIRKRKKGNGKGGGRKKRKSVFSESESEVEGTGNSESEDSMPMKGMSVFNTDNEANEGAENGRRLLAKKRSTFGEEGENRGTGRDVMIDDNEDEVPAKKVQRKRAMVIDSDSDG